MKTIWKYELKTTDVQEIEMPKNSKILCVHVQNGIPCIWCFVDTEKPISSITIRTFGTGHEFDHSKYIEYVGTYQLFDGNGVFHVFA